MMEKSDFENMKSEQTPCGMIVLSSIHLFTLTEYMRLQDAPGNDQVIIGLDAEFHIVIRHRVLTDILTTWKRYIRPASFLYESNQQQQQQ